jgi:hypothetical protein
MEMPVHKRGIKWHYAFAIRGVRYRGAIPEARTKFQAEKAETKIRQTFTTESMDDLLAKRTLWSSLTKSMSLGHAKTNAHSKTMRNISCP